MGNKINAEVISVLPNKIKIAVDSLEDFKTTEENLKVGSYLQISDNDNAKLLAIIENFSIEIKEKTNERKHILEANPLGMLIDEKFERGGDSIAIPPKDVKPANKEDIKKIFSEYGLTENEKFIFSKLASDNEIPVPVDGNKFFNKHIAVVGSTGSGKSNTVAKIIQNVVISKKKEYSGLNNSHVIIFDIHSEYKTAFPDANYIDINNLILPYWLLNSEELQELFIDTEANDHNQRNVFKEAVVESKKNHSTESDEEKEKIHFDSPLFFEIDEVLEKAKFKNEEMVPGKNNPVKGPLKGKLSNFVDRLENKIYDKRLEFLLGQNSKEIEFVDVLKTLISYGDKTSNVTIIDLSGVPFEVLSITVSLISRILFEYGYYHKKLRYKTKADETLNNNVPLLLVYEEAHKYVPNSDLYKFRASKESIERIAKEGRKYGVSLLLSSQRPSEISETIFSQCNNFIAMRLTNPNDQSYVKKLLPDTLGDLINKMPALKVGEALLIGDSVALPSVVRIEECDNKPSSNDIPYFELWKEQWKDLGIEKIIDEWKK
ncbi:hypothetical protein SDC9_46158 [bioreactor metagenome]|uniref:Helicase HerA central domain-containing protein n=1 Tax=bioreactor metagenome TaxID=1076179 RepID=A0A644W8V9_9ZZZZ|nr:ATP-binding protein [Methanobrevibacter sp.]MEA4957819.1 ATP-binding protein [Methanobrevibacter sp.]